MRYGIITCPLCKLSHSYKYTQITLGDEMELFCPNKDNYFLIPIAYYNILIEKMRDETRREHDY